jgi:type I restriction enzyme S subunit
MRPESNYLLMSNLCILTRFFKLLIDESPEIEYQIKVQGKGSIMHGLNSAIVKSLSLPIPPTTEQNSILNFLEHETAKIDTLIDKQQQLIQLLKEKRQAVISHAVTKGLNPDAAMKDSGVEWLGEVPEHWDVTRAKYVSNIFVPQRNKPELNDSEGIAWATMEDMKQQYIESTSRFVTTDSALVAGSKLLKAGSVIASCVGNFGVTAINKIDVIINQQLQAFQPNCIKAEYLQAIVSLSKQYFELIGTAATLVYVNQEGFENLPVLLPLEKEQKDICDYVQQKNLKFQRLIEQSALQVSLLQERRTALISAAVTGKIDVRHFSLEDGNVSASQETAMETST